MPSIHTRAYTTRGQEIPEGIIAKARVREIKRSLQPDALSREEYASYVQRAIAALHRPVEVYANVAPQKR
jgi:hypothetical protein